MANANLRQLTFGDERDEFWSKRFGMFVHWGLYAINGWHEQELWRDPSASATEYEKLATQFNPVHFDPYAWIDAAEQAGMEYICLTTKHHDGFCLWDTRFTDYKVSNSPYGRDILRMLADACVERGMALGLYYSLPDWHHPNYPNMGRDQELFGPKAGDDPDVSKYLEFVRCQVRELCTNYGPIKKFFWDVNRAGFRDPSFNELLRELQPGIVINDRGPSEGDHSTPERQLPNAVRFLEPTEACQSVGRQSWGYRIDEDYYTHKHLMQSIATILAMDGNYILNVGPMADGTIDAQSMESLQAVGRWYGKVREAFDGTIAVTEILDATAAAEAHGSKLLLTRNAGSTYVVAVEDLKTTGILLSPWRRAPARVVLLNTGEELEWTIDILPKRVHHPPTLRIKNLPANALLSEVPVIRLVR